MQRLQPPKDSENGVREAMAFNEKLLEVVPAGIYICDSEGLITYFNQRADEIWGREPQLNDAEDRFCGSFKLFSSDGSPIRHDQCWMALALQTEQAYDNCEIVVERPDGSRVTTLAHAHPIHDETGKLTGAVNTLLDITDRKEAMEAKARLAAIVESADDAIISKNLNGIIMTWNRGAERLFGYTAQEVIGQPVTILMPPDRVDEEPGILERIRRGESIDHYETVRRRKDGTLLDISLSVSPITDENGRIVGASKIARDITERKEAEEALREADRQKDTFLAMLSHELRNPLSTIRNAVELFRLDQGNASIQQEALGILDRQVNTLTRLVDDLLDVSRVTMGRIQLQQADIDLNALVQGVADSFHSQMAERRHEFSVSLAGSALWVHADSTRLEQVVVNLLSNAVKYTPDGGQIWLTLQQDGNEAMLRVRDTGVGIAPDLRPHLFELFSQGDQELDRTKSGLGIGLALVKSLVEMHGGTVTAASDGHGKGSEFVMRLPLILPPLEEQSPQSSD
jgi:PAS domain S-box-containing protein